MMALEQATSTCRAPALPHGFVCTYADIPYLPRAGERLMCSRADIALTAYSIQLVSGTRRATHRQDTYIAISAVPIVLPEHLIHSVTCASCGETSE